MSDTNVFDFSFEESKVIKSTDIDLFKQNKGEKTRVSVVAFKKFHEILLKSKTVEAGHPFSDAEKAELFTKIDAKLAAQLNKDPKDLTEVDRLDIKSPRFTFAWIHYRDGLGTIRCLSGYDGGTLVKPEQCCRELGDATQAVGTIIMTYPVDDDLQADMELLLKHKYTNIKMWRMSAKKFHQVESTYKGAKSEGVHVLDMKITLDGDPKYQNQKIESGSTAVWAREGTDPSIRQWALEQGLRSYKHVPRNLGFEMTKEKLMERLSGGGSSNPAISAEASAPAPQLSTSYEDLLK